MINYYFILKKNGNGTKDYHIFDSHSHLNDLLHYISFRSMRAFPEDYKTLVPKLLIEAMVAVGASFVSRINLATGDVVPETRALAKGYYNLNLHYILDLTTSLTTYITAVCYNFRCIRYLIRGHAKRCQNTNKTSRHINRSPQYDRKFCKKHTTPFWRIRS